jgi:hypothetical protein
LLLFSALTDAPDRPPLTGVIDRSFGKLNRKFLTRSFRGTGRAYLTDPNSGLCAKNNKAGAHGAGFATSNERAISYEW